MKMKTQINNNIDVIEKNGKEYKIAITGIYEIEAMQDLPPHRFVTASGFLCPLGEAIFGVTLKECKSGEMATIQISGIALVETAGKILSRTDVRAYDDNTGRAIFRAYAEPIIHPLDITDAAGDFIRIKL